MFPTRMWIGLLLWFATLASAVAVLDAGEKSNTDRVSTGIYYVLKVLGEVSNMLGMGRSMIGAIVVTIGLIAITILYSILFLWVPASRRSRAS